MPTLRLLVKIGGNTPPLQLNTQQILPSAIESKDSAFAETQEETILFESILIPFIPLLSSIDQPQLIINVAQANSISIPVLQDECGVDLNGADLSKDKTRAPYNPSFYPGVAWQEYYVRKAGHYIDDLSKAKVTIIKAPKNGNAQLGKERLIDSHTGLRVFYIPNSGFRGVDTMAVRIELNGDSVIVKKRFVIVGNLIYTDGDATIVKRFSNGSSGGGAALDKAANECLDNPKLNKVRRISSFGEFDLYAWQRSSHLMNLLADASLAFTGFSDLAGTAVGQATGTSITLDTNAASHGWFVDTTPDDNSDFLATSNPNVWIARAGSAADGKMDMLSVLMHEYGHVLGLDHSADNGDAMSAVLQPGVRKLWSVTELAKLNEIIFLQSNPFDQLPADFPVDYPSNGLPPGETRVSTPVARRPRRDTDVNIDLLSDAKIEALNAINPTLTGGDLLSAQGWETTGAVSIGNGHATLTETARSQSRLTQGFVLSSQDRYLSFTVEGLQMTDSTNGPEDAFEVALLNANTRGALTSTVALTRSDALLNIQANGTERRSDKLRRIDNADGSRTYVLDLLGVGTSDPVALSFDLIGFGAADSQVTIRDVRLSTRRA